LIYPGNPDWNKIRKITLQAIRESVSGGGAAQASATPRSTAQASPGTQAQAQRTPTVRAQETPTARAQRTQDTPRETPTPRDQAAQNLAEACGF